MRTNKVSFYIFLLICCVSTVLQAQNLVSVYPQEYPYALKNPLKGFRDKAESKDIKNGSYTTIVRDYIKWNEIENDSTDGVQKIINFCKTRWKDYRGSKDVFTCNY